MAKNMRLQRAGIILSVELVHFLFGFFSYSCRYNGLLQIKQQKVMRQKLDNKG